MQLIIKKQSFYFVRHGETNWNKQQLCQGQIDTSLNETGRIQALHNRDILKDKKIASICYSPLLRAKETAQIIGRDFENCTFYPIDELKERAWGCLEGRPNQLMYAHEQRELENLEDSLEVSESIFETRTEFLKRILDGMNVVLSLPSPILVVSHGRVFHALCQLINIPIEQQIGHETPVECIPSAEKWSCFNLNVEK